MGDSIEELLFQSGSQEARAPANLECGGSTPLWMCATMLRAGYRPPIQSGVEPPHSKSCAGAHDGEKVVRLQAGAADEGAVHIGLAEERGGVVGLNAAA